MKKKIMNKKIVAVIVVIIFVFITAAVALSVRKVQEKERGQKERETEKTEELKFEEIDTSNWKTYRNEEMGFEIKYPEEFSDIEGGATIGGVIFERNSGGCSVIDDRNEQLSCRAKNRMTITRSEEKDERKMKEYIENMEDVLERSHSQILSRDDNFKIGDVVGRRYLTEDFQGFEIILILGKNNILYVIEGGKFDKTQLTMISTFKLIE